MMTQIVFTIDKKTKERAMRRARREGLSLAAVLRLMVKAYVEGRLDIILNMQPKFRHDARHHWRK